MSNCACSKFMLEERHSRFFGCFEIFFDESTDGVAFAMTKVHGFGIGQSTSHVPAHFECFISDLLRLLLHAIDHLFDLLGIRSQESEAKKFA